MAEVTWNPKKEEREIMFLYNHFADDAGWRERGRRDRHLSMPDLDVAAKKLDAFILDVLDCRSERDILIDKLDDMELSTRRVYSKNPADIKTLMKEIFDNCNLSSEAFGWISPDNQRLCNYIWAYLRMSDCCLDKLRCKQSLTISDESSEPDEEERNRRPKIDLLGAISNVYDRLGLPILANDSHAKKDYIIRFFDLWEVSREKKEEQIEELARAWNKIKNNSKMVDWLNKNDDMAGWAWTYTLKTYLNFDMPAWVDLSNSKNQEKEKDALITLHDLLSVEHRAILMASLSKSGAQQKYRMNSSERKAMSIPLSEEHKDKLKRMAKDTNRRIYQVVEDMIEQEYQHRYPELLK